MVGALRALLDRHRGETVVAASHGTVIALALHHLGAAEGGLAFWEGMPMPAVFRIDAL
jgi:broad specificity phosphatase PhoE